MTISVISVKKNLSKRICHDIHIIHLKPILLHQHTPSHPPLEKNILQWFTWVIYLFIYRTQYITINKHRCDGNRKEEICMIEPLIQDFLETTEMCRNFLPLYIYIYIYIHTHTHTHTLATLLWTPCQYRVGPPFFFRTALILCGIDSTRCWKHSSEILVHIDMIASHSCCRFLGCTSMMRISRSTTSQRCSIGLRSGDCEGNLSKVNSLSCSRNQSELIWALWHAALSCWK